MHRRRSAKISFILAVMLLAAKPFLGFSMFSRSHPPAQNSIFVKAFTKRKQEYVENSKFDIIAIQKKLADPVNHLFLRFSFLLCLLFPLLFETGFSITKRFLNNFKLNSTQTYLLNRQFII